MSVNRPLVIDIWKGDWGLPSVDLECLKVLALVKFSGLEYEVKATNNPFWSPSGRLPVVHQGKQHFITYDEVLSYLTKKNVSPNYGLTAKQESEVEAYTKMLEDKLFPALKYIWWVDEKNYVSVTRRWYGRAIPFPFNFYYGPRFLKEAQEMVETIYGTDLSPTDAENKIYSEATKCLTTLSVKLGENDFIFGTHPTSLDAVMFAYLAPLLKAPFQNNSLQNHLKACTNLYKFVTRINQRYFSKEYKEYENKIKEEAMSNKKKDSDDDYPSMLVSVILAAAAMIGYAFSVGIVQKPSIEDKYAVDAYFSGENNDEEN